MTTTLFVKQVRSLFVFLLCSLVIGTVHAEPPFSGTVFIDADIITESDPSAFESIQYTGQGLRTMYDRRVEDWTNVNAYLFSATYDDELNIEIQVNPEFGNASDALTEAQYYGWVIGQLTTSLRSDVKTVWIHKGTEPFGGGNNNLLIHTGQTTLYVSNGILEETLVHEAAHTSFDSIHANAQGWLDAQTADNAFISTYARDNPTREDIAESYLTYLAVKYRSDRISENLLQSIMATIPNRIAYFDIQSLNMHPISDNGIESSRGNESIADDHDLSLFIPIISVGEMFYAVQMEMSEANSTSIWTVTNATTVAAQESIFLSGTYNGQIVDLPCTIYSGNRYHVQLGLVDQGSGIHLNLLSAEDATGCRIDTH